MQAASLLPKSIYKNSGKIFLIINARPGSKKEGITGKYLILLNKLKEISDEYIGVKISAPPVDGKANIALVLYFSNMFDISKSDVTLEKGGKNKHKLISLNYNGYSEEEVYNILKENII